MSTPLMLSRRRASAARARASAPTLTTTSMRLAVGLIAAAIVILVLTNPSGAQTTGSVMRNITVPASQQQDHFGQCLRDWDAATHMTKQEWWSVCRRLHLQRRDHLDKLTPGIAVSPPVGAYGGVR